MLLKDACADGGTLNQDCLVKVAPMSTHADSKGGYRTAALVSLCDASLRGTKMALKLEEKKVVVAEVNAVAAKALSVVGAENRGLTVTQMTDLRAKARKEGVYLRIVKNTLARKAVAGTSFECISPALKGPIVLAFSNDDPGAAARIVKAFAKDNDKLVTDDGVVGRATAQGRLARAGGFIAHARAGVVADSGCAQSADCEVCWYVGCPQLEVGADAGCCS
jgi:ribosomal protein L10